MPYNTPSDFRRSWKLTARLDMRDVAKLTKELQARYLTLDKAVESLARDYRSMMELEARLLCPVDTGDLRRSIKALVMRIVTRWQVYLRANADGSAPYWAFVEWGTENMDAQPYLRPVLEKYRPLWVRDVALLRTLYITGR